MFEYAIALEVFALDRPEFTDWYDYKVIATEEGDINGMGGVSVNASHDLDLLSKASLTAKVT